VDTLKVELSSGTLDTADVTDNQVGELVTLCSFIDNCIEDSDLAALSANHMDIAELMIELGLTPAYMRIYDE
tara:strand:+ start:524 stop:739 length:216 start_codon:yes stop_codon:yes gene_type:complete